MLERFIRALRTDDPGAEDAAATRARLKDRFPPGAIRRMTRLGLLVGATLHELQPGEEDALIYATQFAEGRALEEFIDSFPAASPTLFQTSIHPSGVQQALIGRQRAVREVFPLAGGRTLTAQALLTAALSPAPRVFFAGGEERGTWLIEPFAASERTFAFALELSTQRDGALARVALSQTPAASPAGPDFTTADGLKLGAWFDLLHARQPFAGTVAPGWSLELSWT